MTIELHPTQAQMVVDAINTHLKSKADYLSMVIEDNDVREEIVYLRDLHDLKSMLLTRRTEDGFGI